MIKPEEQVELSGFVLELVKAGVPLGEAGTIVIKTYYVGYRGAMADTTIAAAALVRKMSSHLSTRPPIIPSIVVSSKDS